MTNINCVGNDSVFLITKKEVCGTHQYYISQHNKALLSSSSFIIITDNDNNIIDSYKEIDVDIFKYHAKILSLNNEINVDNVKYEMTSFRYMILTLLKTKIKKSIKFVDNKIYIQLTDSVVKIIDLNQFFDEFGICFIITYFNLRILEPLRWLYSYSKIYNLNDIVIYNEFNTQNIFVVLQQYTYQKVYYNKYNFVDTTHNGYFCFGNSEKYIVLKDSNIYKKYIKTIL